MAFVQSGKKWSCYLQVQTSTPPVCLLRIKHLKNWSKTFEIWSFAASNRDHFYCINVNRADTTRVAVVFLWFPKEILSSLCFSTLEIHGFRQQRDIPALLPSGGTTAAGVRYQTKSRHFTQKQKMFSFLPLLPSNVAAMIGTRLCEWPQLIMGEKKMSTSTVKDVHY